MSRTTFIDLPRFVTVSLVAIVLAIIGFFLVGECHKTNSLTLTFPFHPERPCTFSHIRLSRSTTFETSRETDEKELSEVGTNAVRLKFALFTKLVELIIIRSIVSITQVNISQTSSPSLARPRQALTIRCRSIPANRDPSRGAKPSKSSRHNLIKRLPYVRRISQAVKKTVTADSRKTAKDTRSVFFGKALSSINAREEPIAEEIVERTSVQASAYQTPYAVTDTLGMPADEVAEPPVDQSRACLRRTSTVQKLNAIFKTPSEYTISRATTNLIKTCKLNARMSISF